jgi:hypothetical protein
MSRGGPFLLLGVLALGLNICNPGPTAVRLHTVRSFRRASHKGNALGSDLSIYFRTQGHPGLFVFPHRDALQTSLGWRPGSPPQRCSIVHPRRLQAALWRRVAGGRERQPASTKHRNKSAGQCRRRGCAVAVVQGRWPKGERLGTPGSTGQHTVWVIRDKGTSREEMPGHNEVRDRSMSTDVRMLLPSAEHRSAEFSDCETQRKKKGKK